VKARGSTRSIGWIDLALLAIVLIWGANYAIVKAALSDFKPLAFTSLRFAVAAVLTPTLAWIAERNLSIQRRDWTAVILLGLTGNVLYQFLFIRGLAQTRASNSSLILATVPVWVALIGTLRGSERIRSRNWVGIVLAFVGIFLLVSAGGGGIRVSMNTLVGDLLVLSATVVWAVYTVLARGVIQRNSPLKVTAWMLMSSLPWMLLFALPELRSQDWQAVSVQSWLGFGYSAVLAIALGYIVWNTGVQRLGSARTSVYNYLPPLVSVAVAWAFLGESMQPLQALGAVGILLGVVLGRDRPKG